MNMALPEGELTHIIVEDKILSITIAESPSIKSILPPFLENESSLQSATIPKENSYGPGRIRSRG
jgi:hypothetical protein